MRSMTNREWLESLSDEELAIVIGGCNCCVYDDTDDCADKVDTCCGGRLKWLQAEHEEADDE